MDASADEPDASSAATVPVRYTVKTKVVMTAWNDATPQSQEAQAMRGPRGVLVGGVDGVVEDDTRER
ncbi:hypothetical protein GCM10023203_15220 [Actinomycetospora straminea]|uniref:Uncharacterized protein n=1 Tax=Actinomycetospora straminea TaxID=663607 RepID=A0ABP9E6N1_9PSEU